MDDSFDLLYLLLLILACVCVWLYLKLKEEKRQRDFIAKENSKLIADNALMETEHLKFQLQPHTLNNLILSLKLSANKVSKGLESLSEILEYILYSGNRHLVSIEQELSFVNEYLKLKEQFIGDLEPIINDDSQVNKASKNYSLPCIPHLVTAYFIENAFKHGEISQKNPLKITLKLTDKEFELNVVNKMKERPSKGNGGIGMSNMKKRLELLLTNKYDITNSITNGEFHSTLTILF